MRTPFIFISHLGDYFSNILTSSNDILVETCAQAILSDCNMLLTENEWINGKLIERTLDGLESGKDSAVYKDFENSFQIRPSRVPITHIRNGAIEIPLVASESLALLLSVVDP